MIAGTRAAPVQVGVWIPKAKLGPTADFFRPLGMPNTRDRLVDAIAAVIMKATSAYMHPSQVVMNCFKEPQHAVNAIQTLLDGSTPMAALLVDLSKAFERVNPYWILHILRMRRTVEALYRSHVLSTFFGPVLGAMMKQVCWHSRRRSEAHRGLPEARPRTQNVMARGQSEAHGDSNLYNTRQD